MTVPLSDLYIYYCNLVSFRRRTNTISHCYRLASEVVSRQSRCSNQPKSFLSDLHGISDMTRNSKTQGTPIHVWIPSLHHYHSSTVGQDDTVLVHQRGHCYKSKFGDTSRSHLLGDVSASRSLELAVTKRLVKGYIRYLRGSLSDQQVLPKTCLCRVAQ